TATHCISTLSLHDALPIWNPHSGNFALFSGPSSSDGFIDQVIPTVAGQAYNVTFWLENDDTSGNNRFGASFGSVTLVPEVSSFRSEEHTSELQYEWISYAV